jgi:hypothetical protein
MGSDYSIEANAILRMKALNSKLRSGAALMLALWALFLLSAMVISWALDINSRLAVSGNASRVLDAEAMAASGADVSLAEVALRPNAAPISPNLHRQMGNREGYDVKIIGECGRLNLNFLTLGEDPTKLEILRQYLRHKEVELNDINTMVDSLLDWVSPGQGIHHLNACPETDDYQLSHAPLNSVEDLKKICGWAEFTSKPGWDDDFTVFGGCAAIDLAWASRDVLRALGIGDDRVDAFLQLRRGPDGIDGTADDLQFSVAAGASAPPTTGVPQEVLAALGLTQQSQPAASIMNLITFNNTVFRVVSVGKSGDVSRTVQMIISGGAAGTGAGGGPQVKSWKEL